MSEARCLRMWTMKRIDLFTKYDDFDTERMYLGHALMITPYNILLGCTIIYSCLRLLPWDPLLITYYSYVDVFRLTTKILKIVSEMYYCHFVLRIALTSEILIQKDSGAERAVMDCTFVSVVYTHCQSYLCLLECSISWATDAHILAQTVSYIHIWLRHICAYYSSNGVETIAKCFNINWRPNKEAAIFH